MGALVAIPDRQLLGLQLLHFMIVELRIRLPRAGGVQFSVVSGGYLGFVPAIGFRPVGQALSPVRISQIQKQADRVLEEIVSRCTVADFAEFVGKSKVDYVSLLAALQSAGEIAV